MDPISFLVVCLAVYGIFKRVPSLIAEGIAEATAASRGEESDAARQRRKRLEDAGIDPAYGGAAAQFFGNWWRDFWLDMDRKRRDRAGSKPASSGSGGGRLGVWLDQARERAGNRADRWRRRDRDTVPARGASGQANPGGPEPSPAASTEPSPQPGPQPAPEPPSAGPVTPESEPDPAPEPEPAPGPKPEPRTEPTRIKVTTGAPINDGGKPMAGTVAVPVTGVVSGAAEARAIAQALAAATAAYMTELARIRSRIHGLGDQALATVQFDGRSTVVNAIAESALAAAQAEAAARSCQTEVEPLLHNVAREFDRRNS